MKSIIIAILSAILYYQNCEIKMVWAAVLFGIIIFWMVDEVESLAKNYVAKIRRGERLCRKIRRLL